jgi:hypothetical protein
MVILRYQETSAATGVGTRLTEQNGLDVVPYPRVIKRIAVVGSAAAGDAAVELSLGQTFIGRFYNTSTGNAPIEAKDWLPVNWVAEAGEPVIIKIADASATNVAYIFIETQP